MSDRDIDRLMGILGNCDEFATIDKIMELCDSAGFWSEEFQQAVAVKAKKSELRRLMKRAKHQDGTPVFASIKTANEDGELVNVYKQETLFDVADYRQVVSYYVTGSNQYAATAKQYAKRCKKRFNVNIPLKFE